MAGGNIDNLYIQISASAKGASNALDKVAASLEKIAGLSSNSGLKGLVDQLDAATKSAKGLSGELNKIDGVNAKITTATGTTNKLNGAMGSLWKTLKKVASISAAIALFKKGYGLSTDFFETANYFRVVMGEYTEDAYKYAQTVGDALGLDESQWMQNQATFMSLAVTFGNTADSAYLMSKNLTQLVYDLSSLKNVDATTAMQKLRSAFAGEIEPLRDWGVDLSKANLQLVALEHNITKPFDKMTQAEKSQLRYVTIMNQLEYAMGDLTNTLSSPGNQLRLLEMAIQKAARAFGNIFIPILNRVIPVVIALANVIRYLFEQIAAFFGFEYPEMTNWDKYSDSVGNVADNLDDAAGSAKKLKRQLAGFDEINNLTTNSGGSGSSDSGYFGGLDLPTYESLGKSFLGEALDQKIQNLTEKLKPLVDLLKGLAPIIIGVVTAFATFKTIYGVITFVNNLTSGIKILWAVMTANPIAAIISLIAGLVAWFITAYNTNEDFRNSVDEFFTAFKNSISTAWENIKTFWNNLVNGAKTTWEGIKSFFANMPTWFANKWQTMKEKVAEKWAAFKQGAADAWIAVKDKFKSIPDWFKEKFATAWERVKQVFSTGGEIFKSIKDGIGNAFKTVLEKLRVGFNDAIRKPFDFVNTVLNKIKDISFLGITPFANLWRYNPITVPQIPAMALGGVVNQPTTALIGENGAEAVVPLENNTQWISKVANEINNNSDDSQIVVMLGRVIDAINNKDFDVTIGDNDIYNANKRETNRQQRLLGRAY